MFKIKLLYFITNFLFLNFLQDYSEQQFFLHPVCGHKFAQLRKTLVYVQTILFLLWNLCAGYEHDYRSISRHQSLRPWCSVVANLIGLCLAVIATSLVALTYSIFVLRTFTSYPVRCFTAPNYFGRISIDGNTVCGRTPQGIMNKSDVCG